MRRWCVMEKAMVCVVDDAGAGATAEHFARTWAARGENRASLGSLKNLEEGERGQQWPTHRFPDPLGLAGRLARP